uniref:ADAMTS-like protein 2-like n=1 Tax=Saccoglossus kowalevskii TaxID=10224 RepID=A0ABM0MGL7_SACKO|nr:PREDICTED: ADAMTS-like protein 2-like [Saccoglossus kowalevskii]
MKRWSFFCVCGLLCIYFSPTAGQFANEHERRWPVNSRASERQAINNEWNNWSGWTECSQTCNIGAAFRKRTCLQVSDIYSAVDSKLCNGPAREYKACNTMPCSSSHFDDFRRMQCSSFDSDIFYRHVRFHWKPYYTRDGCDGKLYSTLTLDKCGICGGNGNQCRTVSRDYRESNATIGYTEIVVIPKGAVHISVVEKVRNPDSYLAMRVSSGEFFLNGYWIINNPGVYEIVGTVFNYTRSSLSQSGNEESITSAGPIDESVSVMLLSEVSDAVHINYKYTVPLSHLPAEEQSPYLDLSYAALEQGVVGSYSYRDQEKSTIHKEPLSEAELPSTLIPLAVIEGLSSTKLPANTSKFYEASEEPMMNGTVLDRQYLPAVTYYWVATYAQCSATCSPGVSESYVKCYNNDDIEVDESQCDPSLRPEPHFRKKCAGQLCDARWVESSWSRCSVTCGAGVKYRSVHCWQIMSEGLDSSVSHSQCNPNTKPATIQACEKQPCGPLWETSEWGECSKKCGSGVQRRRVRCKLSDDSCDIRLKPISEKTCIIGTCKGQWAGTPWSECSGNCGTKSRNLLCLDRETGKDGICSMESKPKKTVEACGQNCNAYWVPQVWEPCSSSCGHGTRTRLLICAAVENSRAVTLQESDCDPSTKPNESAVCIEESCEIQPEWFSTEWSECSRSCGRGIKRREVKCYLDDVPASGCDSDNKPAAEEECEQQTCPSGNLEEDCEDNPTANCALAFDLDLCQHWYYEKACCGSCKSRKR